MRLAADSVRIAAQPRQIDWNDDHTRFFTVATRRAG